MGGGPSAKQRHGGCGVAPSKTAGTGSPAPPGACFMQIPVSESLLFLFPPHRRSNSGRIWRSSQTHVLETEWAWSVGVVFGSSTPDSSTIFAFQLLIASHKQFRGGSGGQSPPVLAFSLRVWGLVSREYDVLVFSV